MAHIAGIHNQTGGSVPERFRERFSFASWGWFPDEVRRVKFAGVKSTSAFTAPSLPTAVAGPF
jgi:hypothetical protein